MRVCGPENVYTEYQYMPWKFYIKVVLIMMGVCLEVEKQLSNSKMCGIGMIIQTGYGKKVYDSICTY